MKLPCQKLNWPSGFGRSGGVLLGICLIVSGIMTRDVGLHIAGYLADLILKHFATGLVGAIWLLMTTAGIGLVATRRGACFFLYVAFYFTLLLGDAEFPFFPFLPLLQTWFEISTGTATLSMHVGNLLFVLLVVGVHLSLARSAIQDMRSAAPLKEAMVRQQLRERLAFWFSGVTVILPAGTILALLLDAKWRFLPLNCDRYLLLPCLVLVGGPALIWGIPTLLVSWRKLRIIRATLHTVQEQGGVALTPREAIGNASLLPYRFQFNLRLLFKATFVVAILAATSVSVWRDAISPSRYNLRFQAVVQRADRIVIRNGGFDCCGPVDDEEVLAQITDLEEIAEVRNHIQFIDGTPTGGCLCCGYPGMDWYCGKKRVALTAIHHGWSLRWSGFPADAYLTPESAKWLIQWLSRHGVGADKL